MQSNGLSASRTRQAYHVLSAMLDDAVKGGRLARNQLRHTAASLAITSGASVKAAQRMLGHARPP